MGDVREGGCSVRGEQRRGEKGEMRGGDVGEAEVWRRCVKRCESLKAGGGDEALARLKNQTPLRYQHI